MGVQLTLRKMMHWGFLLGLLLWGLTCHSLTASAETPLEKVPQGLDLSGFFETGQFTKNAATIQAITNAVGDAQHVIELTNDDNQVGAVWSTPVNEFNLAVDNQISMWVYFGNRDPSEGLAVVFQNDARGNAAISRDGSAIIGENLGVYGTDTYGRRTSPAVIAKTAIQNSWALELDTNVNNGGFLNLSQRGNSFDQQPNGQHLAVSYPADAGTYVQKGGLASSYRFEQHHQNLTDNLNLSNGGWHQLTLKWLANQCTMSYTLDQKITRVTQLDLTKFGQNVQRVTWGLTSTATSSQARTLVVVDQLPNPIEIDSKLNVTNLTKNVPVRDDDWVHIGDQLQYDYRLNYVRGERDWHQIEASLPLSNHVKLTGASIRYADGHKELLSLPATPGSHLRHVLAQALSQTNAHVDITLIGKVTRVDRDTVVSNAMSHFAGPGTRVSLATPHFMIATDKTVSLAVKPVPIIKLGQAVTVNGQIKINDGLDFTNEGVIVEVTLNGNRQVDYDLATNHNIGGVALPIAGEALHEGINELVLRAHNRDGTYSDPVTVSITVIDGMLKFKQLSQQVTFEKLKLTGNPQISRPENWHIVVSDGRNMDSPWQLGVTATPFINQDGHVLAGGLYYRDGENWQLIDNQKITMIESQQTAAGVDYDVPAHWTDQHGLLLKVNGNATKGTYHSMITWSLAAVPSV